jgi:hypothetical protein
MEPKSVQEQSPPSARELVACDFCHDRLDICRGTHLLDLELAEGGTIGSSFLAPEHRADLLDISFSAEHQPGYGSLERIDGALALARFHPTSVSGGLPIEGSERPLSAHPVDTPRSAHIAAIA